MEGGGGVLGPWSVEVSFFRPPFSTFFRYIHGFTIELLCEIKMCHFKIFLMGKAQNLRYFTGFGIFLSKFPDLLGLELIMTKFHIFQGILCDFTSLFTTHVNLWRNMFVYKHDLTEKIQIFYFCEVAKYIQYMCSYQSISCHLNYHIFCHII